MNNYRNSIDNYRRQLGKSELHKDRTKAKLPGHKRYQSTGEVMQASMKRWLPIIFFILLFLGVLLLLYFLFVLEAGNLFFNPSQ